MPKSLKREKAEDIAQRYPNTGNSPLAETLFKENPILYKDKEEARHFLRAVRGADGKEHRKSLKQDPKHFPSGLHNPYDLPEQDHNNFEPLVIKTKTPIKVGVMGDLHLPYQDNKAIEITLNYFKEIGVEIIILNGDVMDAYAESDFVKDPNKRNLKEEVAIVKNFLSALRREFPKARIIFKEGNHEYRHVAYLARKAPEIFGFEETKLQNLLGLSNFDIEWLDNKRLIDVGKLTVAHGHEFGKSFFAPVVPALGFYRRAKKSILGNHLHQVSSYSTKAINKKQHVAYSVGCLCDLSPAYAPINDWSLGFAVVDLFPDDNFIVHNKKIVDYKITNG